VRRIASILAVGALWVATAAAADVSGKWSGSFKMMRPDGEARDGTALLVLKQTGNEITGTVGPNEGEQHPAKGKIDGDKITLESNDGGVVIKLDLVLTGERIAGDVNATREDGQTMKAKLDVTRAK
jgi:hypothetical protein